MSHYVTVGLDLGSTAIRVVETTHHDRDTSVTNFAQIPLPPGVIQNGMVKDDGVVSAALKQLWRQAGLRSKDVILGVTSHQVIVRELTLPNMPPKEMRAALPFQVRDVLPIQVDKALLDFVPLEEAAPGEKQRGLLVAAPKALVVSMTTAVANAGLRVRMVDLASFAMMRAVAPLENSVEAMVDIGATNTTVVVHADGRPRLVRTAPIGGAQITRSLAEVLTLPESEAEQIKRTVGLDPAGQSDIVLAVREAVRPLVAEISNSFAFARVADKRVDVTTLSVCGGGSRLTGLDSVLATDLGVDVVVADPLRRVHGVADAISSQVSTHRHSVAVSVGLTLGAA